jgi:NAD+ diphosphatase
MNAQDSGEGVQERSIDDGPWLNRAAERRSDIDFLESCLATPSTMLLPIWKGQPFTRVHAGSAERAADALSLTLVLAAHGQSLIDQSSELVWLGFFGGDACFALDVSAIESPLAHAALSGSEPVEMRPLVNRLSPNQTELALYARALLTWHQRQQFCGVCGFVTRPRDGGHVRVCTNPGCATQHFPRTDPCVLILVQDGDRCLLGRSPSWPAGMHSALAGFVEPGESLEQAAAREVLEEVGIEIDELRYVGSQPWPFPASLMIGFMARARTREIHVDGKEIEAARWVSRSELLAPSEQGFFVPGRVSLSGQLIAAFASGQR